MEGSVQRSANRVRVSAQLINARNDTHVWAEKYDRELADVFAIQSEIAKAIADQLQAKPRLTRRKPLSSRPPLIWRLSTFTAGQSHFSSRQVSARRASQTCGRQLNFWIKRSSAIPHFSTLTASSPVPTKPFMH